MPLHDASYKHWEGIHQGIWHRRGVIALQGIKSSLQNKFLRNLITVCWMLALVQAALLFMIGQLLVADSIVVQWTANLNPMLQTFVKGLVVWLEQHPEISVHTTQNVMFYYFAIYLLPLSLMVIALAIPYLITRDLASNAIIVYASKAISRSDYLLGKFGTLFGLLALSWLGPLLAAWCVGNFLAPSWKFFWHARGALGNTLLFALSGMLILSLLGLGVSAASAKEKSAVSLWIMWWVIGSVMVPISKQTEQEWLKHLSFNFDLREIALSIFRLGKDIRVAQDNIPVLGNMLKEIKPETLSALEHPAATGAAIGLLIMLALAGFILARKVKPE